MQLSFLSQKKGEGRGGIVEKKAFVWPRGKMELTHERTKQQLCLLLCNLHRSHAERKKKEDKSKMPGKRGEEAFVF